MQLYDSLLFKARQSRPQTQPLPIVCNSFQWLCFATICCWSSVDPDHINGLKSNQPFEQHLLPQWEKRSCELCLKCLSLSDWSHIACYGKEVLICLDVCACIFTVQSHCAICFVNKIVLHNILKVHMSSSICRFFYTFFFFCLCPLILTLPFLISVFSFNDHSN